MKTGAKGSRNERKAKTILEAAGYYCTKAAGSKGVFDIIAECGLGVRHIQVKSNRLPESAERATMIDTKKLLPSNSTVECWIFYDGNSKPRIEVL